MNTPRQTPARFARGWHCLGLARQFTDGRPHEIEAFGTKLAVFRGRDDGRLHVLDAYCRHMGGNLAHGTVKGDTLACPFHDWRWGGDGKCAAIPYAQRVPLRARTRAWTTLEENGQLFVWHDPEGNPPGPGVTIPRMDWIDDEPSDGPEASEWSDWTWDSVLVEGAHCRELVDNIVDMAHFFYVHHSVPTRFTNVFEGHVAAMYVESTPRRDSGMELIGADLSLRSDAAYYGPSYMIDRIWQPLGDGTEAETVLVNCHYPVTADSFVLMYGVRVRRLPGTTARQAEDMAARTARGMRVAFDQDIEIWRHKTRVDSPLLSDGDGPVYQLRRWYEQFYVDAAEVRPEMTDRFEFEVDTRRAGEAWEREMAANLARTGTPGTP
ncbi:MULTISPECIES: Rieske 2Fe-2S domain-containing protein [Streptomyces]|uniref:Rieske 2Fe-2S domain-containing protein n=1 Tax=Streptomyces TaxID=1883 RepID=UPI001675C90F|nr:MULTISPECIES: Rieske 2Fe-2S domain-containing protein [Streptomyces]MBK3521532.1 aromatic ring-hydroxylating dioxygenase subunit alpha [Streptomyces sp. MBT70]GGR90096.1 3-ketosteroid-9-alpha-hydroxylase oxygenase subunit [Streptomyces eurythermus]